MLHIKLDGALELILKYLFLKSPTLLKAITVMNQTLEGYTLRFWKTFFGQSILTLYKAFKVAGFTVILLLRRNTSLLSIRPWIAW